MASRAEEKERRRQERLTREQAASEAARRKRLYSVVAGGILAVAAVAAVIVVVAVGGGSGGSSKGSEASFGTHYQGLQARRTAAGVPTMGEAQTVGAAHFHPFIKVYINGKQIPVPANIGVDPSKSPLAMAGLHTHDTSGTIHNEAGTQSRLGQFFAVWGVPFSNTRLGPYQATKSKKVEMWVDGKPSRAFGALQLKDGQQIVVSYGKKSDEPIS
jgi:hypothetical protein